MIPQLKHDNKGKIYVDGEFEFEKSPFLIYNPEKNTTYLTFTFKWNPEISLETQKIDSSQDILTELIAEKLKQDFIKSISNEQPK